MKKLVLSVAFVTLAVITTNGQSFERASKGGGRGFDVESGVSTGKTFTVDGKTFDVYATKSGSQYMKLVSPSTGNGYAVWIGEDTGLTFEGSPVYRFKSGSSCIYKIGKSGNPYSVWLKEKN